MKKDDKMQHEEVDEKAEAMHVAVHQHPTEVPAGATAHHHFEAANETPALPGGEMPPPAARARLRFSPSAGVFE